VRYLLHHIDKYREVINTNVCNIPERLKEIDSQYFIVRNKQLHCFEVHHGKPELDNYYKTFQLQIPYDELDQRTIDFVLETRIENAKRIIEEIEKHNEKLQLEQEKKSEEITREIAKDIFRYCNNHESKETIDDKAYTTRFI